MHWYTAVTKYASIYCFMWFPVVFHEGNQAPLARSRACHYGETVEDPSRGKSTTVSVQHGRRGKITESWGDNRTNWAARQQRAHPQRPEHAASGWESSYVRQRLPSGNIGTLPRSLIAPLLNLWLAGLGGFGRETMWSDTSPMLYLTSTCIMIIPEYWSGKFKPK